MLGNLFFADFFFSKLTLKKNNFSRSPTERDCEHFVGHDRVPNSLLRVSADVVILFRQFNIEIIIVLT